MREGLKKNQHEQVMLRYCLKKQGHSMWYFMAGQLSASDFARWADYV